MGKGFWHEVSNARDTLCRVECPFALVEWYAYEELEFEFSLLKKENEELKKEIIRLKEQKNEKDKSQTNALV